MGRNCFLMERSELYVGEEKHTYRASCSAEPLSLGPGSRAHVPGAEEIGSAIVLCLQSRGSANTQHGADLLEFS